MRSGRESINVADGSSQLRGRFTSFFADGWLNARALQASQIVAAMLGLAVPIAVGAMVGHARIGMAASLGGLALSGDGKGETFREQAPGLFYALAAGSAAVFAGSAMAKYGMHATFVIPAVAATAGLFGSISRPLARAATQFILFTIIAANLDAPENHPLGMMFLFFLGAAWTAGLSLVLRPLFQAVHFVPIPYTSVNTAQSPGYSARQLLRRWWKSLAHLSGWQYVIRITLCLAAAGAFEWIWPHHHGYWVSITVVIVVRRDLRSALTRTLHRAAGTVFGVLLISLLLLGSPPMWAIISIIAALAAARTILIEINYTAYAAVMTPLVILLLDFGQDQPWTAVIDRLVATFAGCFLGLTLGYLMWSRIFPRMHVAFESKRRPAMETECKLPGT